jgi:hypothetical protein
MPSRGSGAGSCRGVVVCECHKSNSVSATKATDAGDEVAEQTDGGGGGRSRSIVSRSEEPVTRA